MAVLWKKGGEYTQRWQAEMTKRESMTNYWFRVNCWIKKWLGWHIS